MLYWFKVIRNNDIKLKCLVYLIRIEIIFNKYSIIIVF